MIILNLFTANNTLFPIRKKINRLHLVFQRDMLIIELFVSASTYAGFNSAGAAVLINCAFNMISTLPLWEDGPQKCFYLTARMIVKQTRQSNEIKFIQEGRNIADIFRVDRSSSESHPVKRVKIINHGKDHDDHVLNFCWVYNQDFCLVLFKLK